MADLVLKQFYASPLKNANGNYVEVIGRKQGIVAYILSLVRIDPTVTLKASDKDIRYEEGSFFGHQSISFPLTKLTAVAGGWTKPKSPFVMSVSFALGAIAALRDSMPAAGALAAISFICAIYYILNKSLSLGVAAGGDKFHGMKFKRSVIENIPVDQRMVEKARALMISLVLHGEPEVPETNGTARPDHYMRPADQHPN